MDMRIIHVDKYADFLALSEIWNSTLEKCSSSNIFLTWEWLSLWWKYFSLDRELVLLLLEDNEEITGIAPLMYSVNSAFGLRTKKIEFVGTGASDYNGFIVTPKGRGCIRVFLDHLTSFRSKWDCIELTDIPENAESLEALRKASNSTKLVRDLALYECPYTPLPTSSAELTAVLSQKLKKNLRRGMKLLEKDYEVEFDDCSRTKSLTESMNSFFELHQKRWRAKGLSGIFADVKARSFHLDVAKSFARKNWLGLFLLRLSGTPIAAHYGFRYRSKFYLYLTGFDPRYSKYSVANLLTAHIMDDCIQRGLREFDFLRGAEEYKTRWNALTRRNHQIVLTKNSFRASLRDSIYRTYWSNGNKLKHLLKM